MDRNILQAIVFATATCLAGAAVASPIAFSDVWDPVDVPVSNGGKKIPYTFTHDITDSGFDPLIDSLIGFALTLRFHDDAADAQPEEVTITLDAASPEDFVVTSGSSPGTPFVLFLIPDFALLQDDGRLEVTLTRGVGDYVFMDSTLDAAAERGVTTTEVTAVAEPVAVTALAEPGGGFLALLALAAAGVARRRRTA